MRGKFKKAKVLFNTFNDKKLAYCSWKSNEHLEDGMAGMTDLDILVDGNQKEECEKVLKHLDFKQVYSPAWLQYPAIEDWIGLNEETGNLIHVHLHYKILTGKKLVKEQYIPWEHKVLNTRIFNDELEIFTTEPSLELIILAIRVGIKTRVFTLFKKTKLPDNIIHELYYLKERSSKKRVRLLCIELFGNKRGDNLSELIYALDLTANLQIILSLKYFIYQNLSKYKRFTFLGTSWRYFFYASKVRFLKVLDRLKILSQPKKAFKPAGYVIGFLGIDGSGKTTLVKEIHEWLTPYLQVSNIYMGWNNKTINFLKKIKRYFFRSGGGQYKGKNSPRESSLITGIFALVLASIKKRKLRKAKKNRSKGMIVLSDRYPTARTPEGSSDGPMLRGESDFWLYNLFFRIEEKIYKSIEENYFPNLVIKLNTSPEIALKRKPNHDITDLRKKNEILNSVHLEWSTVVEINTSKSLDEVILETKKMLWKNI